MRRYTFLMSSLGLAAAVALASPAGAVGEPPVRTIGPSVVEMTWPAGFGDAQRPLVEFDHARHTGALAAEGCEACHTVDDGGLRPDLTSTAGVDDREALVAAYHDACIGCHQRRIDAGDEASGPVTCGRCHVRRHAGVAVRHPLAFDLALHARHAAAYPDDCKSCHHVWDEAQQKLVYRENTEEACRSCHLKAAIEDTPSLRDAVHTDCVSCHLERARRGAESGPTECAGCHDPVLVAAIEPPAEVPRLMRGQPDTAWVKGPGGTLPLVAFNHAFHESRSASCSTCHHQRLKACADCHGLLAGDDGGGVSLEDAHHGPRAALSCTGCHRRTAERDDCGGCHRDTTLAWNTEASCAVCHVGPRPSVDGEPPAVDGALPPVELAPLPAASDDLPEEVTIGILADAYQPSTFPHLKIIRRFDDGIRSSDLARRFHGTAETMCAGCHHHTPAGQRPPRCAACHGPSASATGDSPSLKVAYHRQCLTCHQRLGIKAGCTDCHAAKEGTS